MPQRSENVSSRHSCLPHLDYSSAAWDPHMVKDVTKLESIQCMLCDKEREDRCMTRLFQELEWLPLAHRRKIHMLTVLYMAMQGEIVIEMPTYVHNQTSHTHTIIMK